MADPQPQKSTKDADDDDDGQITVEDLFDDENDDDDDEDVEIEIIEYVDIVDEGYYTPSDMLLALLVCLVVLLASGIGYGIYAAYDNRSDDNDAAKSSPIGSPTLAPAMAVPPNPTNGGFTCFLCGEDSAVTNPNAIVEVVGGRPTCAELAIRALDGEFTENQCTLLQASARDICGCQSVGDGDADAAICTVCAQGGLVRNPDGILNVSSAGFPGIDTLTCGQLDMFAKNGQIPDTFCPLLQEASVTECDCGGAMNATTSGTDEAGKEAPPCSVCPDGGVVGTPEAVLNVTSAGFPGIDELSCGQLDTFAQNGQIPDTFCDMLQGAAAAGCGCVVVPDETGNDNNTTTSDEGGEAAKEAPPCSVCPGGGEVGSPEAVLNVTSAGFPGIDELSCGQLDAFAQNGQIPDTFCDLLQEAAVDECGCAVVPDETGGDSNPSTGGDEALPPPTCTVCAEGVVRNPDGVLDVSTAGFPGINEVSCGALNNFADGGLIPAEFCAQLQEASVTTCDCGVVEGDAIAPDTSGGGGGGNGVINISPDDVVFSCPVCSSSLEEITNPAGRIDFAGGIYSCIALESFAASGAVNETVCPALQAAAAEPCGCDVVVQEDAAVTSPPQPLPCTVCAKGEVRNPDGVLDVSTAGFPGIETISCGALENFAAGGQIPAEFCAPLQEASLTTCDCGDVVVAEDGDAVPPTDAEPLLPVPCTVCAEGVVRNPDGVLDVTGAGFPGISTISCGALENVAAGGQIPADFCAPLQAASVDICDCGVEDAIIL